MRLSPLVDGVASIALWLVSVIDYLVPFRLPGLVLGILFGVLHCGFVSILQGKTAPFAMGP
jgi:hypothetical protein